MVDRRRVAEPGQRAADDVGLGRVEVAAGGVDAQRPARRPGTASRPTAPANAEVRRQPPGGQFARRLGRDEKTIERPLGAREIGGRCGIRIERKRWRAGVVAEWPRLRCPVKVAQGSGEAIEMMLRPVVVAVNGINQRADDTAAAVAWPRWLPDGAVFFGSRRTRRDPAAGCPLRAAHALAHAGLHRRRARTR